MKIAYVTSYDARNINNWSGLGYFIAKALKSRGLSVELLGPLPSPKSLWPILKAKRFWYKRVLGRGYQPTHDRRLAQHYARLVDERLRALGPFDIVFSPGTIPVAFLRTKLPLVLWSDTTYAVIRDFYREYSNLCPETIRDAHAIENAALNRARATIFSSDWAAGSAIDDYGVPPERVHVVPFGANIEASPSEDAVHAAISARPRSRCQLLFLGMDWERKGGPTALQVAEQLNRAGLPTELTIAGCTPLLPREVPPWVRCEGFISKTSREGRNRLDALLARSHFLLVPSQAECYGLVYCEANAFGVPALARDVGGVSTIIRNGVNGQLLDPQAPASEYAAYIGGCFHNYQLYLDLARGAAGEFRARLNWDSASRQVEEILQQCLRKNPSKLWPLKTASPSS